MSSGCKVLSLANGLLFIVVCIAVFGFLKVRGTNAELWKDTRTLRRANLNYQSYINGEAKANGYLGQKFPIFQMKDIDSSDISTDFSIKEGAILLLFSAQSCQPCLITQIKIVNHIHKLLRYPEKIPIIAISDDYPSVLKAYRRGFDAKYRFVSDQEGKILSFPFNQYTPIIFFVNSNNIIIRCHVPSQNQPQFSALFYHELQAFLNLKEPLFSGHLQKATYLGVINEEYNLDSISELLY